MRCDVDREKIEALINKYDWYQKISLGHGLFTPAAGGDSQAKLEMLQLPDSLAGKSVLDIGCNEGFFSFEAERRGAAHVLGIDYNPSKQEKFEVVKKVLGSKAESRVMSLYDLDPETTGRFDVVLLLAVFHHLRYPFLALDKIAAVTNEVAIMEVVEAVPTKGSPLAAFVRRVGSHGELRMLPTRELLLEILERAGFSRVEIVGAHSHQPTVRSSRKMYDYGQQRVILKAYRGRD